ncbi:MULTISPECIES: carnitine 3-dehydrogenase [unclassified Novosphingobium]|uniref:carnitine 3-dehydrogenase n=1 Tax=unclassified Novosphingobium TaxID=2644732 RepID=UPI0025DB60BB|nr:MULTISPECIES: carnitine 3-dehydrogenase [unclassified Novosphingobium]HQV02187.1 carnitine 3-dehydrogenase [Novosphingobium sp.]
MGREIRKVAIVGGGVIGAAWAARFLLNGIDVAVFDLDPEVERKTLEVVANARRAQTRLHGAALPAEGKLTFAGSVAEAVADADFIQESLPEREDLKQRVLAEVDAAMPAHAVIGSSTSGLLPTKLQNGMQRPDRLVVGHPFNPVYLLPLVEVCGGDQTSLETIDVASALYTRVGMKVLHVRHEIDGFIADRLLEAVWREALWLINDGIATAAEIDDAIRFGAGLRWSFMGTFLTYRLAGGEAGMRHFLHQFGPSMEWPWTKLVGPKLTDELIDTVAAQSDDQAAGIGLREYEALRDSCLVDIMHALERNDFASGAVAKAYRTSLQGKEAVTLGSDCGDGHLLTQHTPVMPEWIDYNDHLTEWAYLKLFGDATDVVLARIGAGPDYVATGFSFYTVETHIRHLGQARLGQKVEVRTRVLGSDGKRLHLSHEMTNLDSATLIATAEHMLVHVDAKAEKSAPAPQHIAQAMQGLAAAQQHLAPPDGAGRSIKMPG